MDYDATDIESTVLHGYAEEEDLDAADEGFMQGYLEAGELGE